MAKYRELSNKILLNVYLLFIKLFSSLSKEELMLLILRIFSEM